ncbi:MAG TPA: hypothetical protein PKB07_19150 [Flavilitoribacter sp.]|nr:hypothetical protein [Flavilitoribacter sp.]
MIGIYRRQLDNEPYDEALYKTESSYFQKQYQEEVQAVTIDLYAEKTARFAPEKSDLVKLVGGGEDIWKRELYVNILLPTLQNAWSAEWMRLDWEKSRKLIEAVNEKLAAMLSQPCFSG